MRVALTGVIQDDEVTVSPVEDRRRPGGDHDLEPDRRARTRSRSRASRSSSAQGPVGPGDTATIQKTLEPGSYEVKAGSEKAVHKEIRPAVLEIGKERQNSNNELLLP